MQALLADLNLCLLRYRWGPTFEYRAPDGEPIMARFGRFGIRLARHRRETQRDRNPLADPLRRDRLRKWMRLDARISLVNPVAQSEPGITILELDCLIHNKRLGRGLIMSDGDADGGKSDGREEVSGELVIAGGNAAQMLELVEEALDEVALSIAFEIDGSNHPHVALAWDVSGGSARREGAMPDFG